MRCVNDVVGGSLSVLMLAHKCVSALFCVVIGFLIPLDIARVMCLQSKGDCSMVANPSCAGAGARLSFLLLTGCLSLPTALCGFVNSTSWLVAQVGNGSRWLHFGVSAHVSYGSCICQDSVRLRVLLRSAVGLSGSVVG